jgi:hypothetical protein
MKTKVAVLILLAAAFGNASAAPIVPRKFSNAQS